MRTNKFFNLLINNKWYISELRYHFGERVAFYFAFCNFYTKFLVPIVVLGTVIFVSFRWVSWHYYSLALSVFGYGVATVWRVGGPGGTQQGARPRLWRALRPDFTRRTSWNDAPDSGKHATA